MLYLKRFLSLFSWRKLAGTAAMLLGLVNQLVHLGWLSLDAFGRVDIAWRLVESMGGTTGKAAAIVSSWQFSFALIVGGILYLVFVGEPEAGVQRHPALPYFAISVVAICLAAIVSIVAYGWFELKMREAYADGAAGVPRNSSPANPQTPSNQRPLYADAARSLTPNQERILITEGARVRGEIGSFLITYLDTDGESQVYARSLLTALKRAAINTGFGAQSMDDPSDEGVVIEVDDPKAPPPAAVQFQRLLFLADIQTRFVQDKVFAAGTQPFVVFVGPRPIQR